MPTRPNRPNRNARRRWPAAAALAALTFVQACASNQGAAREFDLSNLSVPRKYVTSGGPPPDGIPSIDKPLFTSAANSPLGPEERILGVAANGVAKAYPIKILDRHEIVNDRFDGEPVVVTYCPLCGSGIAFDAKVDGPKTFGVSGLLYNSDVLLYDRQTRSLWSQIMGEAVAGPMQGTQLKPLPTKNTTWGEWRAEHADSLVLAGGGYDPSVYERDAYPGYEKTESVWFPVAARDDRLHPKALVLGLELDGEAKAYPLDALKRKGEPAVEDAFAGRQLRIEYDAESHSAEIRDESGEPLPAMTLFWFAWKAFHPDTEVFR